VTIGGSIALIVVGAILRFAITFSTADVNLQLVGVILMIAGAVGLIISLTFLARRRRTVVTRTVAPTDVYEERRYTDPPV
jgi:uncharacterized membrane-anchored protein